MPMHTAAQLDVSLFSVRRSQRAATGKDLLPVGVLEVAPLEAIAAALEGSGADEVPTR
jgi:hypothetical protein